MEHLSNIPPGVCVYAVGDIHGRHDLLLDLHRIIAAAAKQDSSERKVLVYLGDYIDRGPHSSAVIESLIKAPLEGFETVCLKGNHEDLLLRFYEEGTNGDTWLLNGGLATIESYGVNFSGIFTGTEDLRSIWREFRQALPPGHLNFYRSLKTSYAIGDYLFAHAGVKPGTPLEDQEETYLLWIREEFLNCRDNFGKIIVHGHSIRPFPDVRPNRIGIDTGAFSSGCLTCLVLEGEERRFLQT